jgi:hypothetical protein
MSLFDLVVVLILLSVFFGMFRGGAWSWPPANPLHAILYFVAVLIAIVLLLRVLGSLPGHGPRILW